MLPEMILDRYELFSTREVFLPSLLEVFNECYLLP